MTNSPETSFHLEFSGHLQDGCMFRPSGLNKDLGVLLLRNCSPPLALEGIALRSPSPLAPCGPGCYKTYSRKRSSDQGEAIQLLWQQQPRFQSFVNNSSGGRTAVGKTEPGWERRHTAWWATHWDVSVLVQPAWLKNKLLFTTFWKMRSLILGDWKVKPLGEKAIHQQDFFFPCSFCAT